MHVAYGERWKVFPVLPVFLTSELVTHRLPLPLPLLYSITILYMKNAHFYSLFLCCSTLNWSCELYLIWKCVRVRWKQEWGKCRFTTESENICFYLLCKRLCLNLHSKYGVKGAEILRKCPGNWFHIAYQTLHQSTGSANLAHTSASAPLYQKVPQRHSFMLDSKICWHLWQS